MRKLIVDQQLRSKLNGLAERVELCDESGKPLGQVLPHDLYQELVRTWVEAHVTPEELERRRQEPRGRTLAEIWKDLGQS